MDKLIALAIVQAFLNAGASEEDVTMSCRKVALTVTRDGVRTPVSVDACEVYVTRDKLCRAFYSADRGFAVHCDAPTKAVAGATVL